MQENKYLSLLAEKYETKDKVASELINLEAI
ncbi:MAG: fructose-1,6-bisphosphatase, partial [Lactococcus chungangensis]|nr:fructose-1,6-bisphosphatase [Lactococcus chungangensis]